MTSSRVVYISLYIFLLRFNTTFSQENPCPNFFQYETDQSNILYGVLRIPIPNNAKVIIVNVQLSVGNKITEFSGKIDLDMDSDDAISNVLEGLPLRYKITFPVWVDRPPVLTKIVVNNQQLCSGNPIKNSRIIVTINLTNSIKIKEMSGNEQYPVNNIPFDYYTTQGKPQSHQYHTTMTSPIPTYTTQNTELDILEPLPTTKIPQPSLMVSVPQTTTESGLSYPECGVTKSQQVVHLIAFGEIAVKDKYPWLGAMIKISNGKFNFFCGASLITNKHLLTAAHCMQNIKIEKIIVLLGSNDISNPFSGGTFFGIGGFKVHEEYHGIHGDADISIIRLRDTVVFSNQISPVCVWPEVQSLDDAVNVNGFVAGWGLTEKGELSNEIRETQLPVVSNQDCLNSHEYFKEITSQRTFCAGFRNLSGPCVGDSGSGFYLKRNDRSYIRGIVSVALSGYQNEACDLKNYVVFVDVAKYTTWITSNLSIL